MTRMIQNVALSFRALALPLVLNSPCSLAVRLPPPITHHSNCLNLQLLARSTPQADIISIVTTNQTSEPIQRFRSTQIYIRGQHFSIDLDKMPSEDCSATHDATRKPKRSASPKTCNFTKVVVPVWNRTKFLAVKAAVELNAASKDVSRAIEAAQRLPKDSDRDSIILRLTQAEPYITKHGKNKEAEAVLAQEIIDGLSRTSQMFAGTAGVKQLAVFLQVLNNASGDITALGLLTALNNAASTKADVPAEDKEKLSTAEAKDAPVKKRGKMTRVVEEPELDDEEVAAPKPSNILSSDKKPKVGRMPASTITREVRKQSRNVSEIRVARPQNSKKMAKDSRMNKEADTLENSSQRPKEAANLKTKAKVLQTPGFLSGRLTGTTTGTEADTSASNATNSKSKVHLDGCMSLDAKRMSAVSAVETSLAMPEVPEDLNDSSEVNLAETERDNKTTGGSGGSIPHDHNRQPVSQSGVKRKRCIGDEGPDLSKRPAFEDRNIARPRTRRSVPTANTDRMDIDPVSAPAPSCISDFTRPRMSFAMAAALDDEL
ncbi:hypothetical protein CC86DRAFT_422040 [Ophiobolus disseminans]|uniref:Uncharacterized protein n=1 Tax=Ophiobolus disseminans TaxID=1469910 RepID=A0A6A6ZR44_9PLEO|nr:hypothetical protein CC86DRAFT_422040 [Ophiobolus disseminans]